MIFFVCDGASEKIKCAERVRRIHPTCHLSLHEKNERMARRNCVSFRFLKPTHSNKGKFASSGSFIAATI